MSTHYQTALMGLTVLFVVGAAQSLSAMESEVTLNQNKAISGNITPGDGPGFPITITRPGRYVLTSNLYSLGKAGIEIQAYDVTIDFNGFILHGGFQGQTNGIVGAAVNTVKIMNGLIAGFMNVAIFGRHSWVIENMRISANGNAIQLHNLARLQKNTATINGSYGIHCRDGCHIEGNVISENGGGVEINSGVVLGNTIYSNRGFGIKAYQNLVAPIAFGNNMLWMNNVSAGTQVQGNLIPLHPNACTPAC